jgi:hypothetical protein
MDVTGPDTISNYRRSNDLTDMCKKRGLRPSSAVSPMRPPAVFFFYPDGEKWHNRAPGPRFRLNLGFHPSGEPMSTPLPPGERSGSSEEIIARESSGGLDLSATKAGRRPRRIVFPRYGAHAFG